MKIVNVSLFVFVLNISALSQDTIRIDYHNEANKLLVMSDYKNAENNYLRAIELYQIKNDNDRIIDCKFGIATIKYLEGNYTAAVEIFEKIRDNKSILLKESQREAIKSSISICKEFLKASQLKN